MCLLIDSEDVRIQPGPPLSPKDRETRARNALPLGYLARGGLLSGMFRHLEAKDQVILVDQERLNNGRSHFGSAPGNVMRELVEGTTTAECASQPAHLAEAAIVASVDGHDVDLELVLARWGRGCS